MGYNFTTECYMDNQYCLKVSLKSRVSGPVPELMSQIMHFNKILIDLYVLKVCDALRLQDFRLLVSLWAIVFSCLSDYYIYLETYSPDYYIYLETYSTVSNYSE